MFLKVEVIKKVIGFMAIAIGLPFGVMGMVISLTGVSFLFTTINMLYCGNLISYPLWDQIKDISKLFMIGIIIFLVSYLAYIYVLKGIEVDIVIIGTVGLLFAILYLSSIWVFERGLMNQLKSIIKRK